MRGIIGLLSLCKHFDWICRQVFLVETKQALDTGSDQGRDGEHLRRELDKLLIVNELITSGLGLRPGKKAPGPGSERQLTFLITMPASLIQTSSDEGSRRAMGNHPPKK